MVAQVREHVQFREVGGNTKQTLYIADHEADHAKSIKILADNDLRPLTYQEALSHSSELISQLQGKWFYLDGQGTEKSGIYTYNYKGELTELTGGESIAQKVRVLPGNNPLSLEVYSNEFARQGGERFGLVAYGSPVDAAPVVVGVKRQAMPNGRDMAAHAREEMAVLYNLLWGVARDGTRVLTGLIRGHEE